MGAWLGRRARWPSLCEALPGPGNSSVTIHPTGGSEGADPWDSPPDAPTVLRGPGFGRFGLPRGRDALGGLAPEDARARRPPWCVRRTGGLRPPPRARGERTRSRESPAGA
ncbi:hypothetical protein NDU88_005579 [Pleurodeles waltl]|uniref:Uncharacterized protein n=1 Tax=Pleurodeles waltl TaxID=8319 RepID=A0AAV7WY26_PLEWA|nr:hypothetical protein NDU88_005579 [Pleurodeles waltl]